jgi:hypothetical protein
MSTWLSEFYPFSMLSSTSLIAGFCHLRCGLIQVRFVTPGEPMEPRSEEESPL